MIDRQLLEHIGPRVVHVTARNNLAMIQEHGLLPAADLARAADIDPASIVLRRERLPIATPFGTAILNHQNPINFGGNDPDTVIDDHDRQSWAAKLDQRVFFSTLKRNADFENSIADDLATARLTFDTALLLQHVGTRLDLAPINTGYFLRRAARRGNWIYVPAYKGLATFRNNRKTRGLKASLDSVQELSIVGGIKRPILQKLDMRVQ